VIEKPLADGGEGLLEIVGGEPRHAWVPGPLGEPVQAEWRLLDGAGRTAVIEMARASGLALIGGPDGNDPVNATTQGTGELIVAALEEGVSRIIVGCGGSATTDGGLGMLNAVEGNPRIAGTDLVAATDVTTRFLDAAVVFGPQKGATAEQVAELTERLQGLASEYRSRFGVDVVEVPGTGAAGGLGGAVVALGGRVVPGAAFVADLVELDQAVAGASLVVTGEGCLDATSFQGKVVGEVVKRTPRGVPVLVVVGRTSGADGRLDDWLGDAADDVTVVSLVDEFGERRAVTDTTELVEAVVRRQLATLCRRSE
jgi:glycerate kinase